MSSFETALKSLFERIGENPNRKGLQKTSQRMTTMFESFLTGYATSASELLGTPIPLKQSSEECIRVSEIPFCSLCEHHLVPFFGTATLAFVPDQHTLGLSRIFDFFEKVSRKLTLQEDLCQEITQTLFQILQPKALYVEMRATHTCLALSCQSAKNSELITDSFRGDPHYKDHLYGYTQR